MKQSPTNPSEPPIPTPPQILKALVLSYRLNQLVILSLQRTLNHADAVEALMVLPFIERACALRNDLSRLHDAIKERAVNKS